MKSEKEMLKREKIKNLIKYTVFEHIDAHTQHIHTRTQAHKFIKAYKEVFTGSLVIVVKVRIYDR